MEVDDNLSSNYFLAEVGYPKGFFSNQTEYGAIYQLCSTNPFFPTPHSSTNNV